MGILISYFTPIETGLVRFAMTGRRGPDIESAMSHLRKAHGLVAGDYTTYRNLVLPRDIVLFVEPRDLCFEALKEAGFTVIWFKQSDSAKAVEVDFEIGGLTDQQLYARFDQLVAASRH